jgi:hypothetical protein
MIVKKNCPWRQSARATAVTTSVSMTAVTTACRCEHVIVVVADDALLAMRVVL